MNRRVMIPLAFAALALRGGDSAPIPPAGSAPATGPSVAVRWVRLFVRVQDANDHAVSGLAREQFKLFENGRPVPQFDFLVRQPPLRLVLLVDCSRSMQGERLEQLRRAGRALLDALDSQDRVLIAPFNSVADFSAGWRAPREARGALDKLRPGGGTALYDALAGAAGRFPRGDARRVILVLSDGRDERADGLAPGSALDSRAALAAALRADATVVSVGLGAGFASEMDFSGLTPVAGILEDWAARSGGRHYPQPDPAQLGESFRAALRDLRQSYLVIFPSGVRKPGIVPLRVEVPAPLRAFHRPDYEIVPEDDG